MPRRQLPVATPLPHPGRTRRQLRGRTVGIARRLRARAGDTVLRRRERMRRRRRGRTRDRHLLRGRRKHRGLRRMTTIPGMNEGKMLWFSCEAVGKMAVKV